MRDGRERYDERLNGVLRGAAAVFARKGFHQASIRDISRETGLSLSGLYHYVRSKDELLFLIQDHSFGTLLANLEHLLAAEPDPVRQIRLLVEHHLGFFVNNMDEMKVLSHEAESLTGEFRKRVNAKKKRYAELCAGILRALRPANSMVDERVATFALFGMMNWIYNWYRPDRDVDASKLAADMLAIYLEGFLRAGRAAAGRRMAETEAT